MKIILEKEKKIKIRIMSNKVIYAIYNDDDVLMDAVKQTRAAHHHIAQALRTLGFQPCRDWTVAGRNKRYWIWSSK